jgi:hypothetical protein
LRINREAARTDEKRSDKRRGSSVSTRIINRRKVYAWARGQQTVPPVKVEVTVPAVPNVPSIGTVVPSQPPSELSVVPRGIVYIGYRGAYHLASAGNEGHAMFRDANNLFWAKNLTYYAMSNC